MSGHRGTIQATTATNDGCDYGEVRLKSAPWRTRDQLVAVAVDCGYAENTGRVATYKKSELVNSLLWYFDTARSAATPTAAQEKAREWLPDAMRFPAVNPAATAEPEEEPDEVPWEDAA